MNCIAFILEADHLIGMGHIIRCLSLASFCEKLNLKCVFLCPNDSEAIEIGSNLAPQFQWEKLSFKTTEQVDIKEWLELHKRIGFDCLVIDLWEHRCKALHSLYRNTDFPKIMLSSFPFAHQPVFYDILISMGLFSSSHKMAISALIGNAVNYIGPEYVIMNGKYVADIKPVDICREADTVFVCMGGSDPANITLSVVDALASSADIRIEAVIGQNYKYMDSLFKYEKPGRINFYRDTDNIAPVAARCDIGIITGGILRYEMALAGLPIMIVSTFPIQHELSQIFEDTGAAVNMGIFDTLSRDAISSQVKQLLRDFELRKKMHQRLTAITDKNGPERVWQIIDKSTRLLNTRL